MFSSAVSTFARTSRKSAALFSDRYLHVTAASLAKLNVEGLAEKVDLKGQNVLMRVDLNVPLSKEVSFEGLPKLLWILLLSITYFARLFLFEWSTVSFYRRLLQIPHIFYSTL
jgi:hypothetical protein